MNGICPTFVGQSVSGLAAAAARGNRWLQDASTIPASVCYRAHALLFCGCLQGALDESAGSLSQELGQIGGLCCCRDRFGKLKASGDPMVFRAAELKDRPAAVKAAEAFAELAGKSAASWKESKPWLNATELQSFSEQASPAALTSV